MTTILTLNHELPASPLRRKEFQLFHFLYNNKNRVISKQALLELIWNLDMYINSNTLEVHLSSLRRNLKKSDSLYQIETIRGIGYRLVEKNLN